MVISRPPTYSLQTAIAFQKKVPSWNVCDGLDLRCPRYLQKLSFNLDSIRIVD
ncbi:MAG: hypothetical protein ACYT04_50410 [Nostoc sp.]